MEWQSIDPSKVDPDKFDLSKISACKVKPFSGTENTMLPGWRLYADLLKKCPVTGEQLPELTWFLFAAKGNR
jgi:hypothetical protein